LEISCLILSLFRSTLIHTFMHTYSTCKDCNKTPKSRCNCKTISFHMFVGFMSGHDDDGFCCDGGCDRDRDSDKTL